MSSSSMKQLGLTLLHLAVWAYLGVLARGFLGQFFELGCSGQWGPCLEGGIYFRDLPANMLGSYVIGLFAASSTIGLHNDKSLAILPKTHSWQNNFAVQVGIRTGFCGSLTTFSSWVLAAVQDMVDTNDWLTGIFVLIVGLYAAIMSYVLGLHSALLVEKWVLHEDVLAREQSFQAAEIAAYRSGEKRRVSARQIALEEAEPDLPRLVSSVVSEDLAINGSEDAAAAIAGAVTNGEAARDEAGEARPPPPEPAPWKKRNICKTDIAAMVVFAGLTAWAAAGTVTETNHEWLRKIWLALPFGPVGCVARWFLSRYNYKLKGNLVWFPFGTFLANMLGTAAVFGLQAGITRGQPGYWGTLVLSSVQLGLCGALTTVSTFVTEIVKFAEVFPEDLHAYTYSIGSLLGGVVLGLVLYGWVIWA